MQIQLDRLRFYAFHGVMPQERKVGGDFEVSLTLHVDDKDARAALYDDQLEGTINYAEVFEEVKEEMNVPSELLEHVVARIAIRLLRSHRLLQQVDVSLRKCVPPIVGFCGAGVCVNFTLRRRLMVWDFDGTMADTSRGILRTMKATMKECGYPVPDDEAIRRTIGLPLADCMAELVPAELVDIDRAVTTYRRLFETLGREELELFPGVAEALARQRREGAFIGIATSRGHESVEGLCQDLGIRQLIDAIVAVEDTEQCKPQPAPVFRLCRELNVRPAEVTVIGDTAFDMEMGRRAAVGEKVGVSWGNHSESMLREGGADRIASCAEEL